MANQSERPSTRALLGSRLRHIRDRAVDEHYALGGRHRARVGHIKTAMRGRRVVGQDGAADGLTWSAAQWADRSCSSHEQGSDLDRRKQAGRLGRRQCSREPNGARVGEARCLYPPCADGRMRRCMPDAVPVSRGIRDAVPLPSRCLDPMPVAYAGSRARQGR